MEFFRKTTKFDFLRARFIAAWISGLMVAASLASLGVRGLNFGIDFTGGTLLEAGYANPVDLNGVRSQLQASEFRGAVVQYYGTAQDVLIRLAPRADLNSAEVSNRMLELLGNGANPVEMRRVEFVGSQVGEELAEEGGLAMIIALFGILIYVSLRFQMRFSVGAVVALAHDTIITIGFFSVTGMDFDLSVLAAVLAVIGYSLNDTIVVFDRVRENFRRMRSAGPVEVFNASLNQTLSRTIMTGLTTLLVLAALFVWGGEIIHGFSVALIVGIIVGTYSSVYVASPVAIALGVSRKDLLPVEKEGDRLPNRH
ncbi:MAG: protein translocase subunit SecF [Gammaproteobacteria bacterium]|nr:protein translocase subunit SecF [Gammaproteobacteria bacterium]